MTTSLWMAFGAWAYFSQAMRHYVVVEVLRVSRPPDSKLLANYRQAMYVALGLSAVCAALATWGAIKITLVLI